MLNEDEIQAVSSSTEGLNGAQIELDPLTDHELKNLKASSLPV